METNIQFNKLSFLWIFVHILVTLNWNCLGEENVIVKRGLFPDLINLASTSHISANATCGQYGQEFYCKLTEHVDHREPQCGVCDTRSPDPSRRHPPQNAIDGTSSWWQSPTLASGPKNQWVTLHLDLHQVYQVAYVIVKSAISPRPGNWILERSLDNVHFQPWQYYAISDDECISAYGIEPTKGRPRYAEDDEVICTSYFSKLNPLEGGEVHTSLVNGRPGASGPSEGLLSFTQARYIRLRLQKIRTLHGDLQGRSSDNDPSVSRRYFYSIKDISIGGRCVCNGHADVCNLISGQQLCACSHNTCGTQCDQCCPLFNQYAWRRGNSSDGAVCKQCQCHNHADVCLYDEEIEKARLSLNIDGDYDGGGVCLNCQHFTSGINCEICKKGYYRPQGVYPADPRPCLPCICDSPGSSGECIGDDSQVNLGRLPGTCICKTGFAGSLCNNCAEGYLNFPKCEPCPCSRAGSKNKACEGDCICKENVMGPRCDTCSSGTFHLDEYYDLGCTSCFCNGATDKCEAARLAVYTVSERGHWKVTDLLHRRVIAAAQMKTSVSVAQEDMSSFNSYFWLAPKDYLGERLTSYGQTLTVKASWVNLRGDTSGGPTRCPDVIVEGGRYRIAYGGQYYNDKNSVDFKIPFYEQNWYHFPKDLADIAIDMPVSDYQLGKVTRQEMMEVLGNLKTLMIRARFHTEQVESILHDVILEYGKEGGDNTQATLVTGAVERCFCPPGYSGLSCESCEPGYRRVNNVIFEGQCLPCQCHGHVDFCDPFTGVCGKCQHNTIGDNCERCAAGFYGDPTRGTPNDCKPCECPLPIGKNEFTPRCVADAETGGFKCLCPRGYEGPKCERCADGYFGNPLILGSPCTPCNCGGNVDPRARGNCDRLTGQCLLCLGNTAGFNCERCKENHYGDPKRGQCLKCGCHEFGSQSESCDAQTGQCRCKELYTGRQCEQCVSGRGGVAEGCPLCRCDRRGSVTDICDPITGQCPCKPGVGGRHCDSCMPEHFGDISVGCNRCDCDDRGALGKTCDIVTGQCQCRNNVVGRTCNSCRPGYWGIANGNECQICECNLTGSVEGQCDDSTGQCKCRPGVGGPGCERCLPGYWGFSNRGCKPCEPCGFPGRNCDPTSGRCVCPTNTEGDKCERCSQGFWDYSADIGCRPCRCSGPGSLERQCDPRTGRCVCREGYEGDLCNKCSFGFFGYPRCMPCNCDRSGTDPRKCRDEGRCQCDENGQCPCKPNVNGKTCGKCVEGTFGLSAQNPLGCFQCFCFKKSSRCIQADLTWSQLPQLRPRQLFIEFKASISSSATSSSSSSSSADSQIIIRPWNTQEICYINLALPGERKLALSEDETRLNITNSLYVIPDTNGDVTIGTSLPFLAPLYWQLPKEFMRDKIRSYNGYLRFRVQIKGNKRSFPEQILQSYPLVSLQGNWQLVLEFYPPSISPDGRYEVRLHEDLWRLKNDPKKVTREQMMIALQNIQHILIRATHSDDFNSATLSEITLEVAAEGTPVSSRKALGIEQCYCPDKYSGLSCQNPNVGFYRWYKENHIQSTIIIDLVGESKPCHCNGRADMCDQETGVCKNCKENTAGPHCEVCDTGYYGDPNRGRCKPCACPSRQQNFAQTCQADPYSEYICHCRQGYTGNKCERCAEGYFGNPAELGGSCKPCQCDPNGSIGRGCDSNGACRCRPGITGKDCSQCAPRHVVSENGCISCEDGCVNVLLDEVEGMIAQVTSIDVSGDISAPWSALQQIRNYTELLGSQLDRYESRVDVSQEMLLNFGLDYTARSLLRRAEKIDERAKENLIPSSEVKKEAQTILNLLLQMRFILEDSVEYLEHYGISETPSISVTAALDEAERILREIKTRSFKEFDDKAKIELIRSKDLLNRVQLIQQNGRRVDILANRIDSMDDKVSDLLKRIRDAKRTISQTQTLDKNLRKRIKRIQTNLEEVRDLNLYTEDHNSNASRMVRKAERNIKNVHRNFNVIIDMMFDLKNKSSSLAEYEAMIWQLNTDYKDQFVDKAEKHALHLKAQAIKLEKLFNKTRDVADGPLKAAQAYQRIIDALKSAEEAARNASKAASEAFRVAYPGNPEDSLIRRSKHTLDNSADLRSKGDGLKVRVDQLAKELRKQRRDLDSTRNIVDDSNSRLDIIDHKLATQFPRDLSKNITRALTKVDDTNKGISKTLEHVESMHKNLTIIRQYTSQISNLDSSLFKGIQDTIADIEGTTVKGERLSANLRRQSTRIEVRENNLKGRIEALKRKIEQTRQYASSIRVSLTTDDNGICTRKYRPFLQPSTTSRLTLGYAINSPQKDALLLFMSSSNASDFMAVEMVDRKIQFTWNAGGGAKTIIHPLRLETNNPLASDETKWYHITINRVGNIGELVVRPAFIKNSSRKKLYNEPVTGASPAGFSRMDLQAWDFTWIGGAPDASLPDLAAKAFAGCLHYVTIDGEPLGLWNFTESTGCDACNEGFELQVEEEDKTAFGFNGKGYFKGYNRVRRPKPFYSVVLSFKSLDEDALLFLSYNEEQNQYFSIGLVDGHVQFTVQFSEQTQLIMKSEKKLNNMNTFIQIQADVQISLKGGERMGRLVVGDQDQLGTIKGGPDLNLTSQPFYFGGVDPEFKRDRIGKQIELRSMLGCMGGMSVLEVGKNPYTDGQFYGIDKTCPNEPLSDVGFLGQGFLEMPSRVLKRDSNFGFTFKTMESDALLMISTFVGQPLRGGLPNPPDYYSVSLVEGHLDLRLYAGSQRHRMMSRERYNDGRLHSFFVIKENRKIQLFIDDHIVNSTRLDRGSHVVEAPDGGGLFFGGVPSNVNVGGMVGSSLPLKGCIRDVIINNMVLPFNEPILFDDAFVGRCADLPRNAMGGMESDMKHIVSCQPPKQHTVEYGALKFGDQVQSHAIVPIDKNTFRGDFNISFEFRTYYPSGLFFIVFNHKISRKKNTQLMSVQLKNGRLLITIKNSRKEKKIISQTAGLNSGEWRKVVLQKTQRKLRVLIDDHIVNKEKIPKRNRFGNKLFIGSLPHTLANASNIAIQEPFRGCFRNLEINNEEYEIPSLTRQDHIVGVGQCFASVQPGSYFPGDAYALYDDNFQMGPLLELQLEFRTWELNGVLLSVANPESNVALSLELDNGAVVLSVNIGHSHPFSAKVTLPNRFSLCDNQWHTIKAQYIKDSLTLRVESYPEAYGFNGSNNLRKTVAEAPLYIGGLPESAPTGTLSGTENFKGCIRNIVLNSERRDWTDMFKLHHVLLNACPVL